MEASFFDNLTAITSNIEEISFIKYAIITEVNDDNTVNCREKENETIHQDVLCLNNFNSVDDTVLLGFIDNDVYNPIVIGNLNQKGGIGGKLSDFVNDVGFITSDYHDNTKQDILIEGENITIVDNVISATGGGSIIGVGSFRISEDGNLIVTLPTGVSNPYKIVGNNLIYDTGV